MVDLITTKALVYGTRRMRAGDSFRADRADARALIAVGAARAATSPVPTKEPVPAVAPAKTAQAKPRRTRKKAAE